MTPFWPIDHTADLGLLIRSDSKAGLFSEGAKGLVLLLVDEFTVQPTGWREVALEGPDDEVLLVDFLSEVLALAVVEGLAGVAVEDSILSGPEGQRSFKARLGYAPVKNMGGLKQEIKAVTYHGLEIKEIPSGYETTVVFDV
jgi:SHS2 domain-containing protein